MASLDPKNDLIGVYDKSANAHAEMSPSDMVRRVIAAGANVTFTYNADGTIEIAAATPGGGGGSPATMVGATASVGGTGGLTPNPSAGTNKKFLTGAATYTGAAHVAAVAPTATDDSAAGFFVGALWFNSATGTLYSCKSASAGAAVWGSINASNSDDIFEGSSMAAPWSFDVDLTNYGEALIMFSGYGSVGSHNILANMSATLGGAASSYLLGPGGATIYPPGIPGTYYGGLKIARGPGGVWVPFRNYDDTVGGNVYPMFYNQWAAGVGNFLRFTATPNNPVNNGNANIKVVVRARAKGSSTIL